LSYFFVFFAEPPVCFRFAFIHYITHSLERSPLNTSRKREGHRRTYQQSLPDSQTSSLAGIISPYLELRYFCQFNARRLQATQGAHGHGGAILQRDFKDPTVTVHVTTGNGGPPGADNFREDCPGADCEFDLFVEVAVATLQQLSPRLLVFQQLTFLSCQQFLLLFCLQQR
jgi:hypothetical protein